MNKVMLIGNLAADPELRTTGSGKWVCSFRMGVSRRYKDADGEMPTDWINIVAWGKLGELSGKYLSKGKKVAIEGSLQSRSYEDKAGNKRVAYEIVAESVEFLTPKSGGAGQADADGGVAEGLEGMDGALPF